MKIPLFLHLGRPRSQVAGTMTCSCISRPDSKSSCTGASFPTSENRSAIYGDTKYNYIYIITYIYIYITYVYIYIYINMEVGLRNHNSSQGTLGR
jgi:hypothetical protein